MGFRNLIKTVIQQVGGVINFPARFDSGVNIRNVVATLVAGFLATGTRITNVVASLRSRQTVGTNIIRAFFTGSSLSQTPVGITALNSTTGTPLKPLSADGVGLTQVTFNLLRRGGALTVQQTAQGGRSDWANPNNTLGQADGATATIAGNLLAARGGRLDWTYEASLNKDTLTITQVRILFYASQAGTLLGNGSLTVGYKVNGGGDVLLQAFPDNFTNIATPIAYDITGIVGGSWLTLDTIATYSTFQTAVANTSNAAIDAIEIEVTATRTDIL